MPAILLALVTLAPPAAVASDDPLALVLEGDDVPGVGLVTRIDNLALNAAGDWLVEADTDNADSDADQVLLENGVLLLREGQALGAPAGATLDSFDSINLNEAGQSGFNHFLDGTSGSSDDSGVYLDDTLLIQESDIVASPQVSAGTPYIGFFDVKINDADELLVVASIDDSAIPSSVDRMLAKLDVTGGVLAGTDVLLKEGDVPAGQTESIEDFGTGPHESAFNNNGDVMYVVELTGDSATDAAVYLNATLLAQEGSPSPVAGRNWSFLSSAEVDVNDAGDTVFTGSLDGDSSTNSLIVKNGAKFRQEGDPVPSLPSFNLTSFGSGPVLLSESGDVAWYGDWDDPDTDVDTGLFINDTLRVQEGVTTVGGVVIDTLRGIQDGYVLSPDGSALLFEAILEDGREGAFLVSLGVGDNYCLSVPNSTGGAAVISGEGSASIAANDLTLVAAPVPASQNGLFFYGPGPAQVAFGNGFRCIAPPFYRLPVISASAGGEMSFTVDYTNPPSAAGQITVGSTWYFQGWFRDPAGGGSFFNLSDGLEVTFAP